MRQFLRLTLPKPPSAVQSCNHPFLDQRSAEDEAAWHVPDLTRNCGILGSILATRRMYCVRGQGIAWQQKARAVWENRRILSSQAWCVVPAQRRSLVTVASRYLLSQSLVEPYRTGHWRNSARVRCIESFRRAYAC